MEREFERLHFDLEVLVQIVLKCVLNKTAFNVLTLYKAFILDY